MLQHLAKEARSGSTISTFGNQNIDYVSILIDSSPQIEVLTSDFDEELIYMPDVAESPLLPPQIASIGLTCRFSSDHRLLENSASRHG